MNAETDRNAEDQGLQTAPPDPYWAGVVAQIFSYDVLHIRQKVLTLSEKYSVLDHNDEPRFYVVRPPRLALGILAGGAISLLRLGILIIAYLLFRQGFSIPALIGLLIVSNFVLGLAHVLIMPYRDISVYQDESEEWRLLTITQDNKIGFWREYTLYDCFDQELGRLRRNTLKSMVRRDWIVETPDGDFLFRVREDSLIKALLRRYLGPLYGLLRTNFNFETEDGSVFGQYDRKLTLTDQYVLDLTGDPGHAFDRRLTLAMSILLDTGESR